jgi:hypothetical protein
MKTRLLMWGSVTFVCTAVILFIHCQGNEGSGFFTAAGMYGKWNCYKINTYWKSKPDSMRMDTVASLYNLYKITPDSILNYTKTSADTCYRKRALSVVYTTSDTGDTAANLKIEAYQNSGGIALKYNYRTQDSIKEYCLQKIDTALTINVCRFGSMLLKVASRDTDSGEPSVVVRYTELPERNPLIAH